MGCDIHSCFQAKKDGVWVDVVSQFDQERHYYLFGFLDGTRAYEDLPHVWNNRFSGRGFPEDFEIVCDPDDKDMKNHRIACPEIRGYRKDYYELADFDVDDPEHLLMRMGDWGHNHVFGYEILSAASYLTCAQREHLEYFIVEVERLIAVEGNGDSANIRFVYGYDN